MQISENWKDIPGYEGRYQVSDAGRIKSLPFKQRYVLRTGQEGQRVTKEKILATQLINSNYAIVHLCLDYVRSAKLVHRVVAQAFVANPLNLPEVNHIDGVKANCHASNLEWQTSKGNHDHAVDVGLNSQAKRVVRRFRGGELVYPSIARAWRESGISRHSIEMSIRTGRESIHGCQWVVL